MPSPWLLHYTIGDLAQLTIEGDGPPDAYEIAGTIERVDERAQCIERHR